MAMQTPESPRTLSLGTVRLTDRELVLETFSRERLKAGKDRIEKVLGDYILFKLDAFESADAALERAGKKEGKIGGKKAVSAEEQAVLQNLLLRHFEKWIDSPIPALDGKTPRESVATSGGRERVDQLLKQFENNEERKRQEGETYIDVSFLRERLGLSTFKGNA